VSSRCLSSLNFFNTISVRHRSLCPLGQLEKVIKCPYSQVVSSHTITGFHERRTQCHIHLREPTRSTSPPSPSTNRTNHTSTHRRGITNPGTKVCISQITETEIRVGAGGRWHRALQGGIGSKRESLKRGREGVWGSSEIVVCHIPVSSILAEEGGQGAYNVPREVS
jgi:hypothetical protein